ncbi:Crp/Fnr family transcriptional regulator [Pedobacter sp. 22226]|uniref:Crp/Fnr family transcriptional regulator n=1 Tax=Pedobacter sp. 22226 TaxID=3453894 RepID=UPI003F85404B
MDTKSYLAALEGIQKLPAGLGAYLSRSLREYHFKRRQAISASSPEALFLANMQSGCARLYALDRETQNQHTLEFFLPGDFLPLPTGTPLHAEEQLFIEFLEDSLILGITEKHFTYLPRLFSSCTLLYQKITITHLLAQIRRGISIQETTSRQRFERLARDRPGLFNLAPVKDLASYLGMHPNTLSSFRGKT